MICQDCKLAGKLLPVSADVAAEHHARCKGDTWCDCHHSTTQSAINPLLVKPKGPDSE